MSESWRNFQLTFFFLLIAAIFFAVDRAGFAKPIRIVVDFATVPIQRLVRDNLAAVSKEASVFWELRTITQKYRALEKQYSLALSSYGNLSQVENENAILKRQFAATPSDTQKLIPARVIGISRYLIIAKGKEDGVREGQVVVLDNSIIGRVVAISAKSSRVLLPTDPESKITAYIQRSEWKPKGVVIGAFGLAMELEKILPDEKVETGDLLLTAGDIDGDFGHIYPKNLLIGRVTKVKKSDSDLFQSAEVTPIFDYHNLETVFVRLE